MGGAEGMGGAAVAAEKGGGVSWKLRISSSISASTDEAPPPNEALADSPAGSDMGANGGLTSLADW